MRLALFVALSALFPATAAEPPGLAVASSDPQAAQPTGSIVVSAGRFVPLAVAAGKPALVLGNEAGLVELFSVTPATELVGVRYDEPAGAKAKRYTFKKDVTHIAIAGDVGGVVKLTAIVNGATPTSPPSISGELVLTLTGPRPPPKPEPKPDDPVTPLVNPSPFAADGLHVLIVFGGNEPESQKGIIYGQAVRSYLLAKCATGPDGKTKQARIWPATVDASGESKLWQDVFARPRKSVPWIVVGNGKAWEEGPLPATEAEALALLKRYGG